MADSTDMARWRVARKRIESGQLPCDRAARMWGSRGSGAACALCDQPIKPEQIEYEVELPRERARTVQFHVSCHSIWQSECAHLSRLAVGRLVCGRSRPLA